MPLVKVNYGLAEEENFLLSSPAADFLDCGAWSRTAEVFRLKAGQVLRRLPFESFVIDVKFDTNKSWGEFEFFVQNNSGRFGLSASPLSSGFTDLRIACFDGFLQTYLSHDNADSWSFAGGSEFNTQIGGDLFQGFALTADGELFITDYKLYSSPYLTVLGFAPGTPARLVDENGNFLTRFFDDNFECRFFLDRNRRCSFQTLSSDESQILFSSGFLDFTQGDTFLYSTEFIELIHNGNVLDFSAAALTDRIESFSVKNAADEPAADINICVICDNSEDEVLLSFDGNSWHKSLFIDTLQPGQQFPFSLKVNHDSPHFSVRNFYLHIY